METEGTLPCSQEPKTGQYLSQINPVRLSYPTYLGSILNRRKYGVQSKYSDLGGSKIRRCTDVTTTLDINDLLYN
jgi:hypothetical protein